MRNRPLILVVDDDPTMRRSIRGALEGDGYTVATVATGEAALARLAERRPDLVVLDATMPRPDGWDVLRKVRGRDWPGDRVPVVILLDRSIDRAKAYEAGADHYLLKPFGDADVVTRIAALLPHPAAPPSAEAGRARLSVVAEAAPAAEAGAA